VLFAEDKPFSLFLWFAGPADFIRTIDIMTSLSTSRTQHLTLPFCPIAGHTHRDTSGLDEVEIISGSVELPIRVLHNMRDIAAPYTSSK
jgi:hypothetical protein